MLTRSFLWILAGTVLVSLAPARTRAQGGYPQQPQQPQQGYQPAPYGQPTPALQPQQPQQPYAQPQQQPQQQPQPAPPPAAQPGYGQPQPQPQPGAPAPYGAQPGQPQYPQAQPQYPQAQPQYPQAQPQYPQAQPQYPQAPGFPAGEPLAPAPQQGPMPDGAFQLGLSTPIVRYRPLALEAENGGGELDISELTWGIGENPISLELGYGLTENIVLGGTLGLGGKSLTQESPGQADADASEFVFELGPKFDFMFSPGSTVNPFVGAQMLVHLESIDQGGEDSSTAFLFLARVGMRAFLADSFSIDPALVVGGGFGSGSQETGGGAEADYTLSGFQVGLNIAFSGWLR